MCGGKNITAYLAGADDIGIKMSSRAHSDPP
jgi:hypothetical protein